MRWTLRVACSRPHGWSSRDTKLSSGINRVRITFEAAFHSVPATDPISYQRPAKPYIDAIKAVTDKPIKYVIYSHHHYDHIAGGQPFKDLGATFIAHRRTKERLLELKKQNALLSDIVMPDQVVDGKKTITLGGTTLELI